MRRPALPFPAFITAARGYHRKPLLAIKFLRRIEFRSEVERKQKCGEKFKLLAARIVEGV